MRSYIIKKTQGAPDWSKIPVLPIDTLQWTESTEVSAQAQIAWDEAGLYLRMEAVEPNIRMEEEGLLASACSDSCLEFFVSPTERDYYFNIEMTPKRAIWLGFGSNIDNLVRLLVTDVEEVFDSKVEFTEKGWVLTYRIPVDFIHQFFPEFEAKEGAVLHANAYKCGDKTVKPHWLAWNPIADGIHTFHCPEFFGEMTLGGE